MKERSVYFAIPQTINRGGNTISFARMILNCYICDFMMKIPLIWCHISWNSKRTLLKLICHKSFIFIANISRPTWSYFEMTAITDPRTLLPNYVCFGFTRCKP